MSAATTIVKSMWQALGLDLPPRRRSHLMRFFAGLKPLRPAAYASLLRAIARASIDSGVVPVQRDAPHDPVELLAAALEVSIEQSDRQIANDPGSPRVDVDLWSNLPMRVAAFEALFGLRASTKVCVVIAQLRANAEGTRPIQHVTEVVENARLEVAAVVAHDEQYAEAMLAEIVVLGARSPTLAVHDMCISKALPLAHGMMLVRAARFADALALFETMLERVPGNRVVLQQAARCSFEIEAFSHAQLYMTRAGIRPSHHRGVRGAEQLCRITDDTSANPDLPSCRANEIRPRS